jgi:hypothetical protein
MRQEQERMRLLYEERTANPKEAKQVHELEQEISRLKSYYVKRVKEVEDKYRSGAAASVA